VDIELSAGEAIVSRSMDDFGLRLLGELGLASGAKENVFISPLSAGIALGMLNNGAKGVTRDEIQGVLGFDGGATSEDVNSYYGKLVESLVTLDPSVKFASGNSLWADNTLPVLPAFREVLSDSFGAESFNVDFSSPATVDLINGWGNGHTNGLIPRFIDTVPDGTVLALLNALYFKGYWRTPFMSEFTYASKFRQLDGSERDIMMMTGGVRGRYVERDGVQWLELPFGNGAFGMLFVLPAQGIDPLSLLSGLSGDLYHTNLSELASEQVIVHIPRFSLEYFTSLDKPLQSLGISTMYTPFADFSLISSVPLCVTAVLQKTVLRVTESGAEAAAITGAFMEVTAIFDPPPPPVIILDRPFLCFLKEYSTGSLLFAGIIRSPDPVE
jgi:serpin B